MAEKSCCKVGEVTKRYDLDTADPRYESLDSGLLKRWTGVDNDDPVGYRSLTEWFNKRLLRQVYNRHGRETMANRIDHDYEALTGDDELIRQEIIESLESDGIDGATIVSDIVSWGTMRTHLQECLDGTKETPQSESDWERDAVAMAQSFVTDKVESALTSLASKGKITGVDDSSVSVAVQLQCNHCPTSVPLDVALERGYICEQHATTVTTDT